MESAEQARDFVQERKELIAKLAVEYETATKESLRSLLMKFPKGEFSEQAVDEAMDIWAEFDREWAQVSTDNKVFAGNALTPLSLSDAKLHCRCETK